MASSQTVSYETIFFDLDGTLLPIDMDSFLKEYFERLGHFAAERGYDSERILHAVNEGVRSMVQPAETMNDIRFWKTFERLSGIPREEMEPILMEFYATSFDRIGDEIVPDPTAAEVVKELKEKGYQLFLTTMPLFPRIAVEARLRWAGIDDPSLFDRITTYDNSHATKPFSEYYAENIALADGSAERVLMVGNNTQDDLACCTLGPDAFLVTDWLIDPIGFDYQNMKHGSLADLLAFVRMLPERA